MGSADCFLCHLQFEAQRKLQPPTVKHCWVSDDFVRFFMYIDIQHVHLCEAGGGQCIMVGFSRSEPTGRGSRRFSKLKACVCLLVFPSGRERRQTQPTKAITRDLWRLLGGPKLNFAL